MSRNIFLLKYNQVFKKKTKVRVGRENRNITYIKLLILQYCQLIFFISAPITVMNSQERANEIIPFRKCTSAKSMGL